MTFYVADSKEVVRIKVKMCNGLVQPEYKKLCIDPQITSFDILQNLLARAFNIQSQFAISYLSTNGSEQDVYVSLLTDWDLDAAIVYSSTPYLRLKVDLKPFEEGLIDWDISSPVSSGNDAASRLTMVQNSLLGTLSKTVSSVGKAIGGLKTAYIPSSDDPPARDSALARASVKPPMSDAEFRNYLDAVGHLIEPTQFRLAVYAGGIEPSLRRVAWRHLLNVYPTDMTGRERFDYIKKKSAEYVSLREGWRRRTGCDLRGEVGGKDREGGGESKKGGGCEDIRLVMSAVKKDVLRTDRRYPFFAGADDSANLVSLFNLLVTYAVTHPAVSYSQGMSDLAAPLLIVEGDEASAYLSFVALMRRLHPQFTVEGHTLRAKLDHLALLLAHHDPTFYAYFKEHGAEDMFFTYRWLLLEMKREFPLDDAFYMLEVMWSTLPIDAPPAGEGLSLVDPTYLQERNAIVTNPSAAYVNLKVRRRTSSESANNERRMSLTLTSARQGHPPAVTPLGGVSRSSENGLSGGQGHHATKVSHLKNTALTPCEDLDPSEFLPVKTREMEELERTSGKIDASLGGGSGATGSSPGSSRESSNPAGHCGESSLTASPSNESLKTSTGLSKPGAESFIVSSSFTTTIVSQPSSGHFSLSSSSTVSSDIPVTPGPVLNAAVAPTPRPTVLVTPTPAPDKLVAPKSTTDIPGAPTPNPNVSVAPTPTPDIQASPTPTLEVLVTATPAPEVSVVPTSTTTDDMVSSTDTVSDDNISEITRLLDPESVDFVKLSPTTSEGGGAAERGVISRLPPPSEFGDGNPFLMFLCLVTLLQQRDHVMSHRMDYNDLAMHYNKMTRKLDVHLVVNDARVLYSAYLKQQQVYEVEDARNCGV